MHLLSNFIVFAGAVVANRLSEIKHWRILLLEAGPDENEISDVRIVFAWNVFHFFSISNIFSSILSVHRFHRWLHTCS